MPHIYPNILIGRTNYRPNAMGLGVRGAKEIKRKTQNRQTWAYRCFLDEELGLSLTVHWFCNTTGLHFPAIIEEFPISTASWYIMTKWYIWESYHFLKREEKWIVGRWGEERKEGWGEGLGREEAGELR